MYDELINDLREYGDICRDQLLYKAADAIEDLWQALDTAQGVLAEQPSTWIPVTERLPDAGKKVLVFAYGYDTITARMCKKTESGYPVFECKGYDGIYREMARAGRITHWMPLPEPPESEGE